MDAPLGQLSCLLCFHSSPLSITRLRILNFQDCYSTCTIDFRLRIKDNGRYWRKWCL